MTAPGQATDNQSTQGSSAPGTQSPATDVSLSQAMTVPGTPSAEPGAAPPAKAGEGGSQADTEGNQGQAAPEPQLAPWGAQLSKELQKNPDAVKALSKFKSLDELSSSYMELSGKLGTSVALPGKDASPEDLEAFWKKAGKPDKAEAYSFKQDDDGSKAFAQASLAANLTDAQAKEMYKWVGSFADNAMKQQQLAIQQMVQTTETALKAEFKDKYPEKIAHLTRALNTFGGDKIKAVLSQSGLAFQPDIVRMFIRIGEQISESGSSNRSGGSGDQIRTLSEGGAFSYQK